MTTPPPNVFLSLRHTVYPAIRISLSEIELSSFDLLIARISRALCARNIRISSILRLKLLILRLAITGME